MRRVVAMGIAMTGFLAPPVMGRPLSADRALVRSVWEPLVREAALRFGVPEAWIAAVIAVESAGDPAARSPAGAMGLMQLMPETWRALARAHDLGEDAYLPRANVLAGAAYLRALYDRYGREGFLAAYNAGPGRYEDHLLRGRPLPPETRRYVLEVLSRIASPEDVPLLRGAGRERLAVASDWRAGGLFVPPVRASGTVPAVGNGGDRRLPLNTGSALFAARSARAVP